MFSRILIANRGEIALRIIRACKELGVRTVCVYSEEDRDAPYLRLADRSICIGEGPATESYLKIDRIIAAAEVANVDAIHPGYGFLAENSQFADACRASKIEFIGPSAESMRLLGDKIQAKDMMTKFAITATVDETIIDLANLFMRFKISGVPVVTEEDSIIGIVTATDLFNHMRKIIGSVDDGTDPSSTCAVSVKEIMTDTVVTVTEDTTLYDLIKLMCHEGIHTFPVVREDKMVGVIGRRDVINACYTTACSQVKM